MAIDPESVMTVINPRLLLLAGSTTTLTKSSSDALMSATIDALFNEMILVLLVARVSPYQFWSSKESPSSPYIDSLTLDLYMRKVTIGR